MGFPVTHFQIVTTDPERVSTFYAQLCGWTVNDDNPLRYRQLATNAGRGIEGGVWPAPPGAPTFVQLHVEVDDVARAIEKAVGLGGAVLVPLQMLPQGETMAVLRDPLGGSFVVHAPAPKRSAF